MLLPTDQKLGSSEEENEYLNELDNESVDAFIAAYSRYAKSLGTHLARPVAVFHNLGGSERAVITLHVRLEPVAQSLLAVVILQEKRLMEIDNWLLLEFDDELEREEAFDIDCELIQGPKGMLIAEQPDPLTEDDFGFSRVSTLAVKSDPAVDRALSICSVLDNSYEGSVGETKRTLTLYAFAGGEICDDCGDEVAMLGGVIEERHLQSGEVRKTPIRQQLHQNDYHRLCVLLSWLCRETGLAEFTSINHTCQTEEDVLKAISAIHQDEMSQLDSVMSDLASVMQEIFSQGGEDDGAGGSSKPTLH